jgi:4-phytase / acid phosphatase
LRPTVKCTRLIATILAVLFALLPVAAGPPQLKYVVIVTRHGVRSPTWDEARLNQYSAEPWPSWGVPPGDLTPRGRTLIKLMGSYYRDWLVENHLFTIQGCGSAARTFLWADTSERTLETGKALAESLLPGCPIAVHSRPDHQTDPLFSGIGTPDPGLSLNAVRDRLEPDSQKFLADHRAALDTLQSILSGGNAVPKKLPESPSGIGVSLQKKALELDGPLATGSTLSEDFLLEYLEGMTGNDLGWGRLTKEDLFRILDIHATYADLMRRTPYIARARGSNLLEHILRSIEQAVSGKPVAGAVGAPGDRVLLLVGHDTNLSNLSGMLGLSWHLQGYQPDDTPPGGALIFSLWQDSDSEQYFVRSQYIAQTVDQMRNATPLRISAPPAEQVLSIPGCAAVRRGAGCSWKVFQTTVRKAIDPSFISIETSGIGSN